MVDSLRGLFTALAGDVTYTNERGVSVKVKGYDLSTLPAAISTAHLPLRLLVPAGILGGGSDFLEIISAGVPPNAQMHWSLSEVFLLEAAGQGRGIRDVMPNLVNYLDAHLPAILSVDVRPAFRLTNYVPQAVNIELPAGSAKHYLGVQINLFYAQLF